MTAPVFVDNNVLVRREDASDPAKEARADDWITQLVRRRAARMGLRVLQELCITLRLTFDGGEAQGVVRGRAVGRPVVTELRVIERDSSL